MISLNIGNIISVSVKKMGIKKMSIKLLVFIAILLISLTGGIYGYIQYSNNYSKTINQLVRYSINIEVTPSTPLVGDLVKVYVKLVYLGLEEVYVNPFELRAKYTTNLTIVDLEGESIYLSRSLSYNKSDLNERTIMIKSGDSIGIGYAEIVFVKPGRYAIKAHVDGPGLITNEATVELEVIPKLIEIRYENTSRIDDWILTLRVKPENPTIHDNLTLEILLKYVGNEKFTINVSVPLVKMVKMINVKGADRWDIAIPSHTSDINIEPGYSQSFNFTIGPKAQFSHEFMPGIYKVVVYATGYTSKEYPINITVTLFIRLGED